MLQPVTIFLCMLSWHCIALGCLPAEPHKKNKRKKQQHGYGQYTVKPHYNALPYSSISIIALFGPGLPNTWKHTNLCNTNFVIVPITYNACHIVDPKNSITMRFYCSIENNIEAVQNMKSSGLRLCILSITLVL